jgi:uncharacterized membrane protein
VFWQDKGRGMYPRHRLEGLGDAIYGVSITLLVLDIRIPADAVAIDNAGLWALLRALEPHILPYAISFIVLTSGWLASIRGTYQGAHVAPAYVHWWRPQLLLVTAMPFTTLTVARFGPVPLAVTLYAANIGLMSLCSLGMLEASDLERSDLFAERRKALIMLMLLSVAASLLSLWLGSWALLIYLVRRQHERVIRAVRARR